MQSVGEAGGTGLAVGAGGGGVGGTVGAVGGDTKALVTAVTLVLSHLGLLPPVAGPLRKSTHRSILKPGDLPATWRMLLPAGKSITISAPPVVVLGHPGEAVTFVRFVPPGPGVVHRSSVRQVLVDDVVDVRHSLRVVHPEPEKKQTKK